MSKFFTKTLLLFCLLVGTMSQTFSQTSCPTSISLTSQEEVDGFSCTIVNGNLNISGLDITDISALASLERVTGYIQITNTNVPNLDAFDNLQSIGSYLYIRSNPSLQNIDGFNNLTQLGAYLDITTNLSLTTINGFNELPQSGYWNIQNNDALIELGGFQKYTATTGHISIWQHLSLPTIALNELETIADYLYLGENDGVRTIAFPKLKSINARYLLIRSSPALSSIDFPVLERISGYLHIGNNASLPTIDKFPILNSIGGYIHIRSNGALQDLDGFNALTQLSSYIDITSNAALRTINGFNELTQSGYWNIQNNDALIELSGFQKYKATTGHISIWQHLSLPTIALNELETIADYLYLGENDGVQTIAFPKLKGINSRYLLIRSSPALSSIDFPVLERISGYLHIGNNASLPTIDKFPVLNSIGGYIHIRSNGALQDLDGFNALTQLSSYIDITSNAALRTINGFNELPQSGYWNIQNNDALIELNGFQKYTATTGHISIWQHLSLPTIALNELETIADYLYLGENDGVETIAFPKLTGVNSRYLLIRSSPALSSIDFPVLERISGYLHIGNNASLPTIDKFPVLNSIGGYIYIRSNAALQNLDGFNALTQLSSYIDITSNAALKTINGFNELTQSGYWNIQNNDVLDELNGFQKYTATTGHISIWQHLSLPTIALNELETIADYLYLGENDGVENIIFPKLTSINSRYLIVRSSPSLKAATFPVIERINGYLAVTNNPALERLSGFAPLTQIGGAMTIANNNNLRICCDLKAVLNATPGVVGAIVINNNPMPCSSESEIRACENGDPCEGKGGDVDQDGVCAEDDCDDNDPNIGAKQPQGVACNDNDSMTENDRILADGCTCEGIKPVNDEVFYVAERRVIDNSSGFVSRIDANGNRTLIADVSNADGIVLKDDNTAIISQLQANGTNLVSVNLSNGNVSPIAALGGITQGLEIDDLGNIYAANQGLGKIQRINCQTGEVMDLITDLGTDQVADLLIENENSMLVKLREEILRYNFITNELEVFSTGLIGAADMYQEENGNLLVAEYVGDRVSRIDINTGERTTIANIDGGPHGITKDKSGNILVTLYDNGEIKKISPDGTITDFASGFSNPVYIVNEAIILREPIVINSPCVNNGGDIDNDGICANEDCNDNDPNIGANQPEGTACNDNNDLTNNDVILADGCTCEGTIVDTPSYMDICGLADGLAAFFPMDNNPNDIINGNLGTVNGATLTTDRFGNANAAYEFDGVDDYIDYGDSLEYRFAGDYSISLWIETDGVPQGGNLISKQSLQSPFAQNALYMGGSPYVSGYEDVDFVSFISRPDQPSGGQASDKVIVNSNAKVPAGWHHVTLTNENNGRAYLFVDNTLIDSTQSVSGSYNIASFPLQIGGFPQSFNQTGFFKGKIDDIRLYQRFLSRNEVAILYDCEKPEETPITGNDPNCGLGNGLIAYYDFEENANDISGNGNNGIVEGAFLTEGRSPNSMAYEFDGIDDLIRVPNSAGVNNTINGFTITSWVNISAWDQTNTGLNIGSILEKEGQFIHIIFDNAFHGAGSDECRTMINNSFPTNTWLNVTISYDPQTGIQSNFVDGILVGTIDCTTKYQGTGDSDITIGASPIGGDEFFNGKIDDIRIYNRSLSNEEIQALYDCEKPASDEVFYVAERVGVTNNTGGIVSRIDANGNRTEIANVLNADGIVLSDANTAIVSQFQNSGTNIVSVNLSNGEVTEIASLDGWTQGMEIDNQGNVYVVNQGLGKIQRIDLETGQVEDIVTELNAGFIGPVDVLIEDENSILIASLDRLLRYDFSANTLETFVDGLSRPADIYQELDGNLLIAEHTANRVTRVDINTREKTTVATLNDRPHGITKDREGNILVTLFNSNQVVKITSDGTVQEFATGFTNPVHIINENIVLRDPIIINTPCTDTDEDGICDTEDNCHQTPNPDQLNADNDTAGTACDCDDSPETGMSCTEGCQYFYLDSDGDNFGGQIDSILACIAPMGYVENKMDCDDGDSSKTLDCSMTTECDLSDCPTISIDLNTWQQEGNPSNGNWDVSPDGSFVRQTVDRLLPTYFVSPNEIINKSIRGSFKVNTNSDDDFIGFVFGFKNPTGNSEESEYLLFDWKQGRQGQTEGIAGEGYALSKIKGNFNTLSEIRSVLWAKADSSIIQVLKTDFGVGKGWENERLYNFRLDYFSNNIKIFVDEALIFEINGSFESGRFGFYNYSQEDVEYMSFTEQVTCSTFYADTDNDGFGDLNNTTLDCIVPEGYVANADDCDDTDPNKNTGSNCNPSNLVPFDCSAAFYRVSNGQLQVFDTISDSYTSIGPDHPNINSIGYNIEDDLIYGQLSGNRGSLLRIDAEGTLEDLGLVQGLPNNTFSGDFDNQGNLYFLDNINNRLLKVDVDAATLQAENVGIQGNIPILADISFDKENNLFYGVRRDNRNLVKIDLSTLTLSEISTTITTRDNTGFGATYFTGDRKFYAYENLTFRVYEIDVTSGDSKIVATISNPNQSNIDGANCPNAPSIFDSMSSPCNETLTTQTFTTQAQLDSFVCDCNKTIQGDLIINGDNITDLSNLSCIKEVTGNVLIGDSLSIPSNDILQTLDGLSGIMKIGGDLVICNNPALRNLDGFSSLMEVGGDIQVKNCQVIEYIRFVSLTSVGGSCLYFNLPTLRFIGSTSSGVFGGTGLTTFGGGATYRDLPSLVWITGFGGLSTIPGDLFFINVPELESLEAYKSIIRLGGCLHLIQTTKIVNINDLVNLEEIGADVRIIDNKLMTNLDSLVNLTTINGSLIIKGNCALENIDGLSNVTFVRDTMMIMTNDTLNSCCGINDLLQNGGVGGPIMISQNLLGCMDMEDINQHCTDADDDSFPINQDCDDNNPSIYPGATEVLCDGVDSNCNGEDECQPCSTIGDICDDNDPTTINDVINEACNCVGTPVDCPELMANIGDTCDDGKVATINDTIDVNCNCIGMDTTTVVPDDCPELMANIGDTCDDGKVATINDTIDINCNCIGMDTTTVVPDDCPELMANIGDTCDDGKVATINDTIDINCNCIGMDTTTVVPTDYCPEYMLNIGQPCDDNDPNTEDEWLEEGCKCVGQVINGCNATITVRDNTIIVAGVNGAHIKVHVYDRTFSNAINTDCDYWNDCEGTQTFENLLPGVYAVQYQSFNEDWTNIYCDSVVYVEIVAPTNQNDCQDIDIEIVGNNVMLDNFPTLNTIVDVYDPNFRSMFNCIGDCGTGQSIENLPVGDYLIRFKVYDAGWNFVCEREERITIAAAIAADSEEREQSPSINPTTGRSAGIVVDQLSTYPNPTAESINVTMNSFMNEGVTITLTDRFGSVLQKHQLDKVNDAVFTMNIRGYTAGVYQVMAFGNGQFLTTKVIVLR